LKGKYADAIPAKPVRCPGDPCLSFPILAKDMYPSEGGGHLLLVAFERDMPKYDGLPLEKPSSPPKSNSKGKVEYFHPEEQFHRLPGKFDYLVILDSNGSIYAPAKKDFDSFLESLQVD
jgi:hypothetical protein